MSLLRKSMITLFISIFLAIITVSVFYCAHVYAGGFWSSFNSADGAGNELVSGFVVIDALEWKYASSLAIGPLKGESISLNNDYLALFEEARDTEDTNYGALDEPADKDALALDEPWIEIKVAAGDTLSVIAEKYNLSLSSLMKANNLKDQHKVREGQTLLIPSSEKNVEDAARFLKNAKNEEINKKKNAQELKMTTYTVRNGDTLWSIANAFNIDINTLFGCNKLSDANVLKVGTVVKIPNQDGILISVPNGFTIEKLSKRYGIYPEAIASANKLSISSQLTAGSEIFLPGAKVLASGSEGKSTQNTRIGTANSGFRWPVVGKISSPYGWRKDPITRDKDIHTGLDIRAPRGRSIVASQGGRVVHSGWMGGYGKTIVIQHSNGLTTLYAHCSSLLVKKGVNVSKGQQIALVGSTGRSTGNHLHFEIRKNRDSLNPLKYLK